MHELKIARAFWTPQAFLSDGWHKQVLLQTNKLGFWQTIRDNVIKPPDGAEVLHDFLIPGQVNAHSHAFQFAFAGMAEHRETESDSFWSWREKMYQVALTTTPEQLREVAIRLYAELLKGGYTHVCEFHYLHLDPKGKSYEDPLEMAWAMIDAAETVGIGITMLPAIYERSGFREKVLRAEQRRFKSTAQTVVDACNIINAANRPFVNAGVAIHSLRSVSQESIFRLVEMIADLEVPIHIHVSEQLGEVDECIAVTGLRPVQWLIKHELLDPRWNLVHATHLTLDELDGIAHSGATITLCPTTEANLGDGVPDLDGILKRHIPIAIGSDSQVNRSIWEELRWLEYVQRLMRKKRNIAAAPQEGWNSTADRLYSETMNGGVNASGIKSAGLKRGAPAKGIILTKKYNSIIHENEKLISILNQRVFSETCTASLLGYGL